MTAYSGKDVYVALRSAGFSVSAAAFMTGISWRESRWKSDAVGCGDASGHSIPCNSPNVRTRAKGPFQILDAAWPQYAGPGNDSCAFSLACSAKAAYTISSNGSNFIPWTNPATGTPGDDTVNQILNWVVIPSVNQMEATTGAKVDDRFIKRWSPNYDPSQNNKHPEQSPQNAIWGSRGMDGTFDVQNVPIIGGAIDAAGNIKDSAESAASAAGDAASALGSIGTFLGYVKDNFTTKTFWFRVGLVVVGGVLVYKAIGSIGEESSGSQTTGNSNNSNAKQPASIQKLESKVEESSSKSTSKSTKQSGGSKNAIVSGAEKVGSGVEDAGEDAAEVVAG